MTATDYRGARAIINGDVKANGDKVAGYARDFEAALKAAGYTSQKPSASLPAPEKPIEAPQSPPAEAAPQAPMPWLHPDGPDISAIQPKRSVWAAILSIFSKLFPSSKGA